MGEQRDTVGERRLRVAGYLKDHGPAGVSEIMEDLSLTKSKVYTALKGGQFSQLRDARWVSGALPVTEPNRPA
jgi:DNA-binding IclR family transcriptional regulator